MLFANKNTGNLIFLTEHFNETLIQGCFICLKYANQGHLPRWNCSDSENLAKIPQNIFFSMILSVNIGTNLTQYKLRKGLATKTLSKFAKTKEHLTILWEISSNSNFDNMNCIPCHL